MRLSHTGYLCMLNALMRIKQKINLTCLFLLLSSGDWSSLIDYLLYSLNYPSSQHSDILLNNGPGSFIEVQKTHMDQRLCHPSLRRWYP